jgi:hypothetical protein
MMQYISLPFLIRWMEYYWKTEKRAYSLLFSDNTFSVPMTPDHWKELFTHSESDLILYRDHDVAIVLSSGSSSFKCLLGRVDVSTL